jgi:hypothetical protein
MLHHFGGPEELEGAPETKLALQNIAVHGSVCVVCYGAAAPLIRIELHLHWCVGEVRVLDGGLLYIIFNCDHFLFNNLAEYTPIDVVISLL